MKTIRRTFEALKHPPGSSERARLNLDWLTSEYQPTYLYGCREDDGTHTPFVYRTKAEAEARCVPGALCNPQPT